MVRKSVLIAALVLSAFGARSAEKTSWQPAAGHEQIPLWPGTPPGSHTTTEPETSGNVEKSDKPWIYVSHVSRPTLTVYAPTGKSTGAAVVVFPGGGYQNLAIDIEGTEVCDWLTSKGIACILLKYRVPNTGAGWNQNRGAFEDSGSNMALEDA